MFILRCRSWSELLLWPTGLTTFLAKYPYHHPCMVLYIYLHLVCFHDKCRYIYLACMTWGGYWSEHGGWYCWCVCNPANQLDMVNASLPFTWHGFISSKARMEGILPWMASWQDTPNLKTILHISECIWYNRLKEHPTFLLFQADWIFDIFMVRFHGGDPIYPPEEKRKIIDSKVRWEKEMFSFQEGKPPCFSTKSKRKALELFTHLISPSLNQSVWSKKHTHTICCFFCNPTTSDTLRFCKKNTESFDTTPWQLRSEFDTPRPRPWWVGPHSEPLWRPRVFFEVTRPPPFWGRSFFGKGIFRFWGGILLSRSLVCWEFFAVVFFVWSPSKWVNHLRELSHNHGFFVKKWVYLPLYLR